MANPTNIGGGAESTSFSLNDLNDWIAQNEGFYGLLTGIAANADQTVGTFDMDEDPPAPPSRARLPGQAGADFSGAAWINGVRMDVDIHR